MSLKKPFQSMSRETLKDSASGYVADSGYVDSGLGGRRAFVLGVFLLLALALVARAFQLQVLDRSFYKKQGDVRQIRTLPLAAHRGMLLDRNGEPLAVSSPIDSIWADPRELSKYDDKIDLLSYAIEMDPGRLREMVARGLEIIVSLSTCAGTCIRVLPRLCKL